MIESIRDHSNRVIPKQGKVDIEEVFHMAQLNTWLCMKFKLHDFNFSHSEWFLNLFFLSAMNKLN